MKKHNKWRARDLGFVIGLLFDGWTMFHRRRCSSLSFWRVYNLSVPRSPIAERRWTRMSWISRRRWWHDTWLDFSTINSVAEAEITTKPSENVLAMTTLCRRLKFLISCVGSVDSVAQTKKRFASGTFLPTVQMDFILFAYEFASPFIYTFRLFLLQNVYVSILILILLRSPLTAYQRVWERQSHFE